MSTSSNPPSAAGRRFRPVDLSLRWKVLSLAVFAAVGMIILSTVGAAALSAATRTSNDVVSNAATPALHAAKAGRAWAIARRLVLTELLTGPGSPAQADARAKLLEQEARVAELLDAYAGAQLDASQKAGLAEVRESFEAARDAYHDEVEPVVLRAATAAQLAAGSDLIETKYGPLADRATAGFDKLITSNEQGMVTALAEATAVGTQAKATLWGVAAGTTIALVVLGWWVAGLVSRPVSRVQAAVEGLAAGDLTVSAEVDSADEVGQMAAALGRAQGVLRESLSTIVSSSATLAGSAEELSAVSAQVAASAEETSVQSGSAAAAAEQVSRNVQTVAAATEQMSASIREISQSSTDAVRVAQSAAEEAQNATGTVAKLGDSSREIGDVVKVITSIAEQTNLLALNATIEAARAGEAGKGFAVVASEVKDLAQETARATEDISRRIEAIQSDSEAAVAAIARISQIIEEVNSYQTTIASAVEEQTATTTEMSRNVQEAASGAGGIAGNIEYVATAAQSSSTGIVEAQRAAAELAQLSGDLRELVGRFRI